MITILFFTLLHLYMYGDIQSQVCVKKRYLYLQTQRMMNPVNTPVVSLKKALTHCEIQKKRWVK